MRTEVHETIEDVRDLRPAWEELELSALDHSPFVSPEWLVSWWTAFAEPEWQMRFVTVRDGDELRGIAPLVIRTERRWKRSCRVLRFWANAYSNRIGLLVSGERAARTTRAIVQTLHDRRREWDVADLGPTVLGDRTTELLVSELDRIGAATGIDEGYSSPYRRLPDTWEAMEESLGSSSRQSFRRKVRKGEGKGLTFEVTADPERLADVLSISRDTWQHAEGTGIGSTPAAQVFFELVAEESARAGRLQLAFLSLDGRPVAFEFNLTRAGRVYNLKVGYRREHRDLSPGLVLRYRVLEHAVRSGFEEFDFLGKAEDYKMRWASGVRPHGGVLIFSRRPYWRLVHLAEYRAGPFLKARAPQLVAAVKRLRGGSRKSE